MRTFVVVSLYIAAVLAAKDDDEKSYNDVYARLKDDNYKIDGSLHSAVLVLFGETENFNTSTETKAGQSFVIPTDRVTKLKINDFYTLTDTGSDTKNVYCKVIINYRESPSVLVYSKGKISQFIAAIGNTDDDSHLESVEWDTDCSNCGSEFCMDGFCSYDIKD